MAITYNAYRDENEEIVYFEDGSPADIDAVADPELTPVPGMERVTSNDGNDDETPASTAVQSAIDLKYDASNPSNFIDSAGAPVQSVNGDTGTVTVTAGGLGLNDTDDLSEGSSNLYYTEGRVSANTNVSANSAHSAIVTGNPHNLDSTDVGADPAGTASSAVSAHEGAADPHSQYLQSGDIPTNHAEVDATNTFTESQIIRKPSGQASLDVDTDGTGSSDSAGINFRAGSNLWGVYAIATQDELYFGTNNGPSIGEEFIIATDHLDAKSKEIRNVVDPTSAQDAATKAYVDSVAGGGGSNWDPLANGLRSQDDSGISVGIDPDGTAVIQTCDDTGKDWVNEQIGAAGSAFYAMRKANGTKAARTNILNGDKIAGYSAEGYDGTSYTTTSDVNFFATEDYTPTTKGSKVVIRTTPNTTASPVDSFTVEQSGQIRLDNYGSGNYTGTEAFGIAVDASGNIIERMIHSPDRSVVDVSSLGFSSGSFITIPGLSTTVMLEQTGTVTGTFYYSAARAGGSNSSAQFRVVVNGNNGISFFDTLSTFNDTGAATHYQASLGAGTYTVLVQAAVTASITITVGHLIADAVEG